MNITRTNSRSWYNSLWLMETRINRIIINKVSEGMHTKKPKGNQRCPGHSHRANQNLDLLSCALLETSCSCNFTLTCQNVYGSSCSVVVEKSWSFEFIPGIKEHFCSPFPIRLPVCIWRSLWWIANNSVSQWQWDHYLTNQRKYLYKRCLNKKPVYFLLVIL